MSSFDGRDNRIAICALAYQLPACHSYGQEEDQRTALVGAAGVVGSNQIQRMATARRVAACQTR